ncbi:MAG: hypothetical protein ACOYB3_11540 [Azonexus sp.]
MEKTISAEMGRRAGSAGSAAAMSRRLFRVGDRVRLLRLTPGGGQDEGVVIKDQAPDDICVTLVTDAIILSDLNGYANVCKWWEIELMTDSTLAISQPQSGITH